MDHPCLSESVGELNSLILVQYLLPSPSKWYKRGECFHVTQYHGASEPLTTWFSSLPLAATFMEHWKRKQMRLNYRWDLTGFEEEEVSGLSSCTPCVLPHPHPVPFGGGAH